MTGDDGFSSRGAFAAFGVVGAAFVVVIVLGKIFIPDVNDLRAVRERASNTMVRTPAVAAVSAPSKPVVETNLPDGGVVLSDEYLSLASQIAFTKDLKASVVWGKVVDGMQWDKKDRRHVYLVVTPYFAVQKKEARVGFAEAIESSWSKENTGINPKAKGMWISFVVQSGRDVGFVNDYGAHMDDD